MDLFTSKQIRVAKFLAIVGIVYIHSYNLKISIDPNTVFINKSSFVSEIEMMISKTALHSAVPLLFLLAGFLFFLNYQNNLETIFRKFKSRFKTLVVPYFLWSTIILLIVFGMRLLPSMASFDAHYRYDLLHQNFFQWLSIVTLNPLVSHFWFIRALLFLILTAPVMYWVFRNKIICYAVLAGLTILYLFDSIPRIDLLEQPVIGGHPLFFFSIGAMIAIHGIKIESSNKLFSSLIGLWIAILFLLANDAFINNPQLQAIAKNALNIIGVSVIWIISFFLTRKLKNDNVPNYVNMSFLIFVVHEPTISFLEKAGAKLLGTNDNSLLLMYFFNPIVVIIFIICLGIFLKSKLPKFYSASIGERDT
jgi:hypothetical protein